MALSGTAGPEKFRMFLLERIKTTDQLGEMVTHRRTRLIGISIPNGLDNGQMLAHRIVVSTRLGQKKHSRPLQLQRNRRHRGGHAGKPVNSISRA